MKTCTIDISTHAPRTGSDFTPTANARKFEQFQPTLPARGATIPIHFLLTFKAISTHAPRTGSDQHVFRVIGNAERFQPTLPARGATTVPCIRLDHLTFQPTLPARGATSICSTMSNGSSFQPTLPARGATCLGAITAVRDGISTHAPRTGSDRACGRCRNARMDYFNPRSPHGERPGRGSPRRKRWHFNPRSPHGERHGVVIAQCSHNTISTHAPRTGSDAVIMPIAPTKYISTHAPRTGSDSGGGKNSPPPQNFNPRSPHGERRVFRRALVEADTFQPTLPARGATGRVCACAGAR